MTDEPMQQKKPAPFALVGVGAANVDVHGQSRKAVVLRDSNPGYLHTSAGGVTRNVLENAARQGVSTALLSAVGDDVYGEKILKDSAAAGIDVSHVCIRRGAASSCYIAVLDETGDMLLGMSDMRIIEALPPSYLAEKGALLRGASAVVCDGCLPAALLERLVCEEAKGTPVFIDPVSTAYARHMAPLAGRFYGIKPNRLELEILSGMPAERDADVERAAERLLRRGTRCLAVSLGARGCYYADAEGRRMFRALRPVETMVNATGAGDAFLAGWIHGFIAGLPLEAQLDYALASGILATLCQSTINPGMSDALVQRTILEYRVS